MAASASIGWSSVATPRQQTTGGAESDLEHHSSQLKRSARAEASRLVIALSKHADPKDVEQLRHAFGASLHAEMPNIGFEVWERRGKPFTRRERNQIAISASVAMVALDTPVGANSLAIPNDPDYSIFDNYKQWSLINRGAKGFWDGGPYRRSKLDADIDMPEAWAYVKSRPWNPQETIVAVFDTGIDWLHPDLQNRMWVNPGEIPGNRKDDDGNGYVDDVHGFDFGSNQSDPMDRDGHGTHVAGIIGAQHNNGIGITGVNPYARLMAIKILNDDGVLATSLSNVAKAVEYSVAMGATIANHSWGGAAVLPGLNLLELALKRAGEQGQLTITAAGNDTTSTGDLPFYPNNLRFPQKISVASSDAFDGISGFSNYSPGFVDIAAPGSDIFSTYPRSKGSLKELDGTSMAAPFVAGVASLIKSTYPDLTPTQIRRRILDNVDLIAGYENVVNSRGRLNAFRALHTSKADPLPPATLNPQWQGGSGMSPTFPFVAGPQNSETISTSWGDTGNFLGARYVSLDFYDLPAFKRSITSAKLRVFVWQYVSPDASETIELRLNNTVSPQQLQDRPFSQPGGQTFLQDAAGTLLGSKTVIKPVNTPFAPSPGSIREWIEIPLTGQGLTALNRLRQQGGGTMLLSLGLKEIRDPGSPDYQWESISLSTNSGTAIPELILTFEEDTPPTSLAIAATDADKPEGQAGGTPFSFPVTRTGDTSGVSSVRWAVSGSGRSPAKATDFSGKGFPSGSLSFKAGESTRIITVNVLGDRVRESDERFTVTLSRPSGASLTTGQATGIIRNDDVAAPPRTIAARNGVVKSSLDPQDPIAPERPQRFKEDYTITGSRAGVPITVSLEANGFDAYLQIINAKTGRVVAFNDDSNGRNSQLVFTPQAGVTYLARATSYEISGAGTFTLKTSQNQPNGNARVGLAAGNLQNDTLIGSPSSAKLDGSEEADLFVLPFGQSPINSPDRITNFQFGVDKIKLLNAQGVAGALPKDLSIASKNREATSMRQLATAVFADADGTLPGRQPLAADSAAIVQATNNAIGGTYLLINDGNPALHPGNDQLLILSDDHSTLPSQAVMTVQALFS
jgi:subtilisin family serine protease